MTPTSYCSECDAPPNQCQHNAPRYLDPIIYEPLTNPEGKHVGWKVPHHEQKRGNNQIAAPPTNTTPNSPPNGRTGATYPGHSNANYANDTKTTPQKSPGSSPTSSNKPKPEQS